MHKPLKNFIPLLFLFCSIKLFAQNKYMNMVKEQNLSPIWMNLIDQQEENGLYYKLGEPLGFIGSNYQRFYIHYQKITQSKTNPLQYEVVGKTKVKNFVSEFKGTLLIKKAEGIKVEKEEGYGTAELIKLTCILLYEENKNMPNTGIFSGEMISYVYTDEANKIQKASISLGDGECYNQTKTTWTSYKTKIKKKCHWGEDRIPACGDLDNGAGEFYVNPKYIKNGWQSYADLLTSEPLSARHQAAVKEELKLWWED